MLVRNFAGVDLPPNSPFREISSHKFRARAPARNSPATSLPVVPGKRKRPSAASRPKLNPRPRTIPVRGPDGKFVPGLSTYAAGAAAAQVVTYDPLTGAPVYGRWGGTSERARLKNIRAQRSAVLQQLRAARAARLRDGTIKRLKEASRQLLNRSKLTRGL